MLTVNYLQIGTLGTLSKGHHAIRCANFWITQYVIGPVDPIDMCPLLCLLYYKTDVLIQ